MWWTRLRDMCMVQGDRLGIDFIFLGVYHDGRGHDLEFHIGYRVIVIMYAVQ